MDLISLVHTIPPTLILIPGILHHHGSLGLVLCIWYLHCEKRENELEDMGYRKFDGTGDGICWWADDAQVYGMDGCGSTWGLCTRWDYWLVRLYVPPGMGDMRVEWRQPE